MTIKIEPYKFVLGKYISCWFRDDEFKLITIYGEKGMGKSTYAAKVAVDVISEGQWGKNIDDRWAWDMIWDKMVFHPIEFLARILELGSTKRTDLIIWEDAGLWLNALDWHDPFVKSVMKYLNVARTDMACLMLTTPTPSQVLKKIIEQESPMVRTVLVQNDQKHGSMTKLSDGTIKDYKYREARLYKRRLWPDNTLSPPFTPDIDRFSALMPDWFYAKYDPYRDSFAELAKSEIDSYTYDIFAVKKKEPREKRLEQLKNVINVLQKHERTELIASITERFKLIEFIEEAGIEVNA